MRGTHQALGNHRRYISTAIAPIVDDQGFFTQLRVIMLDEFVQPVDTHVRNMDVTYFSVGGFTHFPDVILYPIVIIKLRFVAEWGY